MKISSLTILVTCVASAWAAAVPVPTAVIQQQTISGILEDGSVDTFKGIPFGNPPLGDLRFKHPTPYTGTYSGLEANDFKGACMQLNPYKVFTLLTDAVGLTSLLPGFLMTPLYDLIHGSVAMSEDCLYLNVFRPAGTTATDKLPVMVWIYGGAFLFGSTGSYSGNSFVKESVKMGQPVIYVSIPYRMGPYGFLGGSAMKNEGSTNAGLHDQRLALKWIQDNIASFGGDPSRVMLFGESSGSISVAHQITAYGGGSDSLYNGKPLFSSAIMQSGSCSAYEDVTSHAPQSQFDRFATKAGCDPTSPTVMACLRSKSDDTLATASNSYDLIDLFGLLPQFFGFSPRNDGDIIPDNSCTLFKTGKFTNMPIIIGTNQDEGTLFGITAINATSTKDVSNFLKNVMTTAPDSSINNILTQYPNDITQGAPFGTSIFNAITPQFKRVSAIITDFLYNSPRRTVLAGITAKRYNFFSTALHNVVPILGTFHASDVIFQFFLDIGPFLAYRRYWISFANNHDPNVGTGLAQWNPYTNNGKETLNIAFTNQYMTTDNFRVSPIGLLQSDDKIRV